MEKPKVIFWDTEISPAVVEGYGNKWDFRYLREVEPQHLMCYAYKEKGEKQTHFVSMHDFEDEKSFIQSLADLLDSADITVAHNGIGFDDRMANTFFITNGIERPSPSKSVDTLRVARRKFRFPSNTLNDLGEYLGVGTKAKVTYGDIYKEFLVGDERAVRLMAKYNKQDVVLLEKIYEKMLPYIDNHPNFGVYMREEGVCAHCGEKNLQKRGIAWRTTGQVQQYWCNKNKGGCGSWSYDRLADTSFTKPSTVSAR